MSENATETRGVLGAGSPILDVLINVREDFLATVPGAKGGMELVDIAAIRGILAAAATEEIRAPGGSAANTIYGVAKLGAPTGLLGKVGKDANGDYYVSRFRDLGCATTAFKYDDVAETGLCLSLVTPDSERTMRTFLGAAAALSETDVRPEDFRGYARLHMEGYMLFNRPLAEKILSLAHRSGLKISLDLASFEVVRANRDALPELLRRYVDVVFANETEAAEYAESRNPEDFLKRTEGLCEIAAVKVGKEGALIRSPEGLTRVPARVVNAVDTTGAGDLWQAGFLYGLRAGLSPRQAGEIGAILGAEVVQVMGAAIPENRWDVIRRETRAIAAAK